MKTIKYRNPQDILEQFERNQKDLTLDDARIHWASPLVRLLSTDGQRELAVIRVGEKVVPKVMRWCVNNAYRCSQIRDGRIWI